MESRFIFAAFWRAQETVPCMDDFERELKAGFLEEAGQLLADTEQCFLTLESNPDDSTLLDKIFRLAHNLKGSAKAVGFDEVGAFAHVFESFLLKVKNGEIPKTSAVISLLLACNDFLRDAMEALRADMEAKLDSASLVAQLEAGIRGEMNDAAAEPQAEEPVQEAAPAEAPVDSEAPSAAEVAVLQVKDGDEAAALLAAETEKHLNELIADQKAVKAANNPEASAAAAEETKHAAEQNASLQAEADKALAELLADQATVKAANPELAAAAAEPKPAAPAAKPAAAPAPAAKAPAPAAAAKAKAPAADESIRVSIARLEKLLNFVGEMVILQTVLREQAQANNPILLRRTVHQLGKVTKEVQEISMSLRMVPVKQTFQKMQRIVRDTATLLGKKVQLHLSGEETELDKTVMESIGDPLVHLIRNAVDHGIESADRRKEAGKPVEGNVFLSAYHQGGKLIIDIKDDGGGIPAEVLRKKAREKGIIGPNQTLSDKDAVNLVFHPGFSTKAVVTEVSGRGVGMDVVKTNIEALQGEVQIETELGKGTTFKVVLPLTLAIIDGMVVRDGEERFVIPLAQVHESVQPRKEDVQYNVGLSETLILRKECLPLVRLSGVLGKKSMRPAHECIAIVIRTTGKPFAILVDDIIGQFQIVVKKLGPELARWKVFSGSAILGDGRPALILEPAEVASLAASSPSARPAPPKVERMAS